MVDETSSAGRYDVTEELGRGSMGIVCLAHDPVMGRDVAIKTILLPNGLPDEEKYEFRRRFRREAQAAGRLSHPGIVTVYDYSESEETLPFIAMEYVEGFTLHELVVREGSLNPSWALDMAAMLADALDAAHAAGVVHRDLKPANILIRESDGAAKITDFGIAKINSSEMTQAGTTYGSPAYMAPERIQGQPADARSDLFSLAVILYEALSGARPFDGEDFTSICYAIVNEPPVPIRTVQPALSLAFDAFFRRALAKNPAERFQDGASFRQGLESVRLQQERFDSGSETLRMMVPSPAAEEQSMTTSGEIIATPVKATPAEPSTVPWRWIAVGALAMTLLLISFLMGWIFSSGDADGQVGVPLDVNTHPATTEISEVVQGTAAAAPATARLPEPTQPLAENPVATESAVPSEPVPATPEPAAPVESRPTPPAKSPEPKTPVELAETVAPEPAEASTAEAVPASPETLEAPVEEAVEPLPAAVAPQNVAVRVLVRNGIKEGNLTLLVNGEEIESTPLGKDSSEFEMQIEIPPGHHTLTVVAHNAAKDRDYEAVVDFDLEVGDLRTLKIVAGKALGKKLTVKLD